MFSKKPILFIILFYCVQLHAQELLPFVENFTKSDYAGDNQVWSVVQGNDNAVYFANNHFFLRYNGVRWEKYSLPNKTIIRSVFSHNNRIYTGSYREFGYWVRTNGVMRYTSLSSGKKLFSGEGDNEEIWKIFSNDDKLYFQSFNALYVVSENNDVQRLKFPSQVSYCYVVDGEVYAATVRNGIYVLKGNAFSKINAWQAAENNVIHGIHKNKGITYVFTKNNGILKGSPGSNLYFWDTPINNRLRSEMIHNALFANDSTLVIGTARQGLYIVNINDGTYKNISRQNRLNNNAVLSIAQDNEKDLWLGLDNGISHIEINSPVSVFSDNTGMLGSVYSLAIMPSGYLFASNHGVFSYDNKSLKAVEGSSGQAWEIYPYKDQYILGHNDGTFIYDSGNYYKGNAVNGGWRIMKSDFDNCFFETTYSGINAYRDFESLSRYVNLKVPNRPYKNMAQVKPGELWVAENNKGLYRITYSPDLQVKAIENITEKNAIDNDFGVRLLKFRNEILFLINNKWYRYNSIYDKLEKDAIFNANFKNIADIIAIDDDSFIVMKDNLLYLITQTGEEFIWRLLPEKYYMGKLITDDTRVFKQNDIAYINLDDGFLTFSLKNISKKPARISIEAFYDNQLINDNTLVKYNRSVTVNIISEYLGYDRPDLYYTLNNSQEYLPVKNGSVLLNNLGSGNQDIDVYSKQGHKYVKVSSGSFRVARPWYFSFWMILVYIFIVVTVLFLYYRWNKLQYMQKIKLNNEELKHKREILELEMEAEMKLRQQEYEKHKLEMEVQHKASEVAGKSLSIAKHSEMIESIQDVLNSDTKGEQLKGKIKRIIKTSTISKNEWQSFEKNLIKSHEEFVERLTKKYPGLTPKDIKLSIYLKMNLSSKEIAPLMNISFRGVELHRYRLRKKLDIATEESLTKFMLDV